MDTLCHAALVCCILSALAGLVRTFWPQNGFKPVINAVLTLYIITSVLHAVSGLNWQNLTRSSKTLPARAPRRGLYRLRRRACHAGIRRSTAKDLRQSGIDPLCSRRRAACMCGWFTRRTVNQAETLLQNFAGDLPYTLENTQ